MPDYKIGRLGLAENKRTRIGPGAEVPLGSRGESYLITSLLTSGGRLQASKVYLRTFAQTKFTRIGPDTSVPLGTRGESYKYEQPFNDEDTGKYGISFQIIKQNLQTRIGPGNEVPSTNRGQFYRHFVLGEYTTGVYVFAPGLAHKKDLSTRIGPDAAIPETTRGESYSDTQPFSFASMEHRDAAIGFGGAVPWIPPTSVTYYLMGGWLSGTPVAPWTSSDPGTADQYPGGPPYPSPFYVIIKL